MNETAQAHPLYHEAIREVREMGHVSVAGLQRRMLISYTLAERFVEAMEADGYVSPRDLIGRREITSKPL